MHLTKRQDSEMKRKLDVDVQNYQRFEQEKLPQLLKIKTSVKDDISM